MRPSIMSRGLEAGLEDIEHERNREQGVALQQQGTKSEITTTSLNLRTSDASNGLIGLKMTSPRRRRQGACGKGQNARAMVEERGREVPIKVNHRPKHVMCLGPSAVDAKRDVGLVLCDSTTSYYIPLRDCQSSCKAEIFNEFDLRMKSSCQTGGGLRYWPGENSQFMGRLAGMAGMVAIPLSATGSTWIERVHSARSLERLDQLEQARSKMLVSTTLIPGRRDFIRETGTVAPSTLLSPPPIFPHFLVSDLGPKPATLQAVSSPPQAVNVILKLSSSCPQVVLSRSQAVNFLQFPNSQIPDVLTLAYPALLRVCFPANFDPNRPEAVFASTSFLRLFLCSVLNHHA
ncbi:hypothetical protein DFH09DRAFT_1278462 [Mycena vulgaris]|nr:hypothetical protein DFH09DRAFT_1286544 [Mycena vulgaris]KAJ6565772.1 hypothetical protein DFH09DRAFT_1278462 [Mycena vulgaris]